MSIEADTVMAILRCEHSDPHSVLGAHPSDDGVVIRALRPGASGVSAILADETVELVETHPDGFFEATVQGASMPLRYRLRAEYGPAGAVIFDDPYVFLPTLGELDVYLIGEGRHEQAYERLGARVMEQQGVAGTAFAVWAPSARAVSVTGDFNFWDGRIHQMRTLGSSGVWEIFIPGIGPGQRYKYEILGGDSYRRLKADPYAQEAEHPPRTASVVYQRKHQWAPSEERWQEHREVYEPLRAPVSIYEVHLGSWRLNTLEGNRSLTYLELADELSEYVADMGFTHVELLPVMAHPFTGSWGYQVTSYYAPTPLYGAPDDLRVLVERLHAKGIGVLVDWVPAHFPRDDWALARFDGTALYEHDDPKRGAHPDWGTLVFNYGRHEVRNFLIASALFWLREYHMDGIRVDAVASMLYLDYSRKEGEWIPNKFGGREDLDAVSFLKELNEVIYGREPGAISAAEESTAWTGVSRPTYLGGLGFGFKWNMGWMHDTLAYFQQEPVYRRYHHNELTFSMIYAFTENFILPLSHDEVVHGKGSLYSKMPGDNWQKLANLRALYGYQWAHPGKKLLFMGCELAQYDEWRHDQSLPWHLLENPDHAGIQALVRELNRAYTAEPALWELDNEPGGFWWLEPNDVDNNVFAFARCSAGGYRLVVCVANLSPVPRLGYRLGLPRAGRWRELMNTDAAQFGGGHVGNRAGVETEPISWHGQPQSAEVTLPPLATVWLVPGDQRTVGDERTVVGREGTVGDGVGTVVGREGTVGDGVGTVVGGERTGTDDQPVAAEELPVSADEPPVSADELPVAPDARSTHPELP
ncbi:MAG: 1,4-alpha-glucan branching protein GlgB [Solirubrobacteraceae bacterium]